MNIYIAGPMTGLPDLNYPAFNAAAKKLRDLGHTVENPAENPVPQCGSWKGYMRMSIIQLMQSETVALLPGWETSKGAQVEHHLAQILEMPALPIDEFGQEIPNEIDCHDLADCDCRKEDCANCPAHMRETGKEVMR